MPSRGGHASSKFRAKSIIIVRPIFLVGAGHKYMCTCTPLLIFPLGCEKSYLGLPSLSWAPHERKNEALISNHQAPHYLFCIFENVASTGFSF
jgi:hypothetical protein